MHRVPWQMCLIFTSECVLSVQTFFCISLRVWLHLYLLFPFILRSPFSISFHIDHSALSFVSAFIGCSFIFIWLLLIPLGNNNSLNTSALPLKYKDIESKNKTHTSTYDNRIERSTHTHIQTDIFGYCEVFIFSSWPYYIHQAGRKSSLMLYGNKYKTKQHMFVGLHHLSLHVSSEFTSALSEYLH